jgi:hypothetical protein
MLNPEMRFDSDRQADLPTLHNAVLSRWGGWGPLVNLVFLIVGLALVGCSTSLPTPSTASGGSGGKATVEFVAPEKFTDLQLGGQSP